MAAERTASQTLRLSFLQNTMEISERELETPTVGDSSKAGHSHQPADKDMTTKLLSPLLSVFLVAVSTKKETIANKATSRRCQDKRDEELNRTSNKSGMFVWHG